MFYQIFNEMTFAEIDYNVLMGLSPSNCRQNVRALFCTRFVQPHLRPRPTNGDTGLLSPGFCFPYYRTWDSGKVGK